MVLGTKHVRAAGQRRDVGQWSASEGRRRPHLRQRSRVRLAHLWSDVVWRGVLLGLQQRRTTRRRDKDASNATGLCRASRWLTRGAELRRSGIMSRIGRTLATLVVVALSNWSCSSTAAP